MRLLLLIFFLMNCVASSAQSEDWFSDITESSGLNGTLAAKAFAGDLNNDRYPDLVIISGVDYFTNRQSLKVFINEPAVSGNGRTFADRTEYSGINRHRDTTQDGRRTTALAMADIDNDGDLDIITGIYFHRKESVPDNGDRAEVLLNDGTGKFSILLNSGLEKLERLNTQGISFLDADKDGAIDVFLGNWSEDHTNNIFQRDALLLGKGDGTFKDFSFESGINSLPPEPLYGSSCGDWNNDGYPDIFTAPYCRTQGSLWKNNGNLTFSNVAATAGYNAQFMKGDNGQALCMWAAYPADYDNDGDFDFFYTLVHGGLDANEGRSTIVENLGADSAYKLKWRMDKLTRTFPRPNHQADYEACWFDMNNDGYQDLIVGQGSYDGNPGRLYAFMQNPDHSFEDISVKLNLVRYPFRPSNRVRTFDFDLDGDEDLFISGGTSNQLYLIKNEVGNRSNFIGFHIKGKNGSNAAAIGARVELHSAGGTQTREIYAGQGNASGQGPFFQLFGLGNITQVDSVVMTLPNKESTRWVIQNPGINVIHEISEKSFLKGNFKQNSFTVVYPNPGQSHVKIMVKDGFWESGFHAELLDEMGRKIMDEKDHESGLMDMNISHLRSGIYFIKIITHSGDVQVTKLLKF